MTRLRLWLAIHAPDIGLGLMFAFAFLMLSAVLFIPD